jgi:hypothetical protein
LKKILIISYFYPPANFVGGERTAAWARYLHENGFYPIIITRQWNDGQTDLIDKVQKNILEVEYNGTHEVHRLPYKYSLRDRCARYKWLKPLQKAFTLLELIGSNFFIRALPYSNFYFYSKDLIKRKNDISFIIASGRPFQSFFIGHKLKNDFPNIYWIPDYRDEWNKGPGGFWPFLKLLENNNERRWISNADMLTTVNPAIKKLIETEVGFSLGEVILNGYDGEIIQNDLDSTTKEFPIKLIYLGTLYPYQPIEEVMNTIVDINNELGFIAIHLTFIGVDAIHSQKNKVEKISSNYKSTFCIKNRTPNELLTSLFRDYDLGLSCYYINYPEIVPVKVFEYLKQGVPTLHYSNTNDKIVKFLMNCNAGYSASSKDKLKLKFKELVSFRQKNKSLKTIINTEEAFKYSRKHQTAILAKHLSSLLHEK